MGTTEIISERNFYQTLSIHNAGVVLASTLTFFDLFVWLGKNRHKVEAFGIQNTKSSFGHKNMVTHQLGKLVQVIFQVHTIVESSKVN